MKLIKYTFALLFVAVAVGCEPEQSVVESVDEAAEQAMEDDYNEGYGDTIEEE